MIFHTKKQEPQVKEALEQPYTDEYREEEIIQDTAQMSAPLFVKVEKYREVLSDIQEMKVFIYGMKQLFGVLSELEAVRGDALKILRATVQRLEKNVTEVDSELLRPKGFELEAQGEMEIRHIEDSLSDLQKQLASLKKELQELR